MSFESDKAINVLASYMTEHQERNRKTDLAAAEMEIREALRTFMDACQQGETPGPQRRCISCDLEIPEGVPVIYYPHGGFAHREHCEDYVDEPTNPFRKALSELCDAYSVSGDHVRHSVTETDCAYCKARTLLGQR